MWQSKMGDKCSQTSWKASNNKTKLKTIQIQVKNKKNKEEL